MYLSFCALQVWKRNSSEWKQVNWMPGTKTQTGDGGYYPTSGSDSSAWQREIIYTHVDEWCLTGEGDLPVMRGTCAWGLKQVELRHSGIIYNYAFYFHRVLSESYTLVQKLLEYLTICFSCKPLVRTAHHIELLFFGTEEFTPTLSLAWAHASPSWSLWRNLSFQNVWAAWKMQESQRLREAILDTM